MNYGNERTKELIEWLDRLGFKVDIYKVYIDTKYLKAYNIIVRSKKDEREATFGADTIEEMNGFLTGYIYATIDTQCRIML